MRIRPVASLVAATALALGLSGCSLFAVHQTLQPYDASDGVSVTVGDVRVINAIVFTEDGQDGNFSAAAVNRSDSDIALKLQYVSEGEKVDVELDVPAGETVRFGGEDDQVILSGLSTAPGSLVKIYFQYGNVPGKQIDVPVLDTALEEYDGLLPSPTPTPNPTRTITATPAATETPAP